MSRKQITTQYVTMSFLLLCIFINPLEQVSPVFKWIDEFICLGVCLGGAALWLPKSNLRRQIPKHLLYFIPLFVYMFMQLLGSLIFQYQPWKAVIIDALTNAKFWLALYGCFLLGKILPKEPLEKGLVIGARIASAMLFALFILEQFWIVFPDGLVNDNNPNIQCAQMMYLHPSYLAAILAFLLAALLSQWELKSLPYIIADLIMMTFTFRAKAYGTVLAFIAVVLFVIIWKQKVRFWQIGFTGAAAIAVAWKKIIFYFVTVKDISPRPALLSNGLKIMLDFFPLGTGFATFASHQAGVHYSPVYYLYGLDTHHYLGVNTRMYMDDSFWPIVFAQSGAIGTVAFLSMLLLLGIRVWKLYDINRKHYAAALFCLAYVLIISLAEPAFNNQTSLPLALLLGYWLGQADQEKERKSL